MPHSRRTKDPILDPRSIWVRISATDLQSLENGHDVVVRAPEDGVVVFGHSGGRAWAGKGYFLPGRGHHNVSVGTPYFEVRTTEKVTGPLITMEHDVARIQTITAMSDHLGGRAKADSLMDVLAERRSAIVDEGLLDALVSGEVSLASAKRVLFGS